MFSDKGTSRSRSATPIISDLMTLSLFFLFARQVVRPWLNLSEPERLDLVASYFHFAGTAYSPSPPLPRTTVMSQPTRPDDSEYPGIQPGGLYEHIESIEVVPRENRSDPLWVVRAKRRSD
jgi:hypothetical protein